MQFEGWFAIGDSVVIEPSGLTGIVEETSLRSTKLRSVGGDVIYVNNSQIRPCACCREACARSASSSSCATKPRGAGSSRMPRA